MSAFLGKIHYWLYDKIKLHEELIENIIGLAKNNGYDSDALLKESYSRFGLPVTGALENEIEHTNIHGWLQERIISVESRLAYIVTELLNKNIVKQEDIADIFYKNAANVMKEIGVTEGSAQEFFNLIFNYMLEGMPCDRVNEVTENSENIITWETTRDLHKDYWNAIGGDVNNYHNFRESWINGFLSVTGYKYVRTEGGINTIRKD